MERCGTLDDKKKRNKKGKKRVGRRVVKRLEPAWHLIRNDHNEVEDQQTGNPCDSMATLLSAPGIKLEILDPALQSTSI